eukprot:SAG11_NODE_620_length_8171_cov_9.337339_2_plen_183_part_00
MRRTSLETHEPLSRCTAETAGTLTAVAHVTCPADVVPGTTVRVPYGGAYCDVVVPGGVEPGNTFQALLPVPALTAASETDDSHIDAVSPLLRSPPAMAPPRGDITSPPSLPGPMSAAAMGSEVAVWLFEALGEAAAPPHATQATAAWLREAGILDWQRELEGAELEFSPCQRLTPSPPPVAL